jgi:hypothetical protein
MERHIKNFINGYKIYNPITYTLVSLWFLSLMITVVYGLTFTFYQLVTNPNQFKYVSWGLFDYL